MRSIHFLATLAAVAAPAVATAAPVITLLDVTVTSSGSNFSAPIFTFTNLSSPSVKVDAVSVNGGAPWDFVLIGGVGTPGEILNPAGGTRQITQGQESAVNANNGCTAGISYNLTSFDTGDFFRFSADPETPGCGNAVVDVRPFLSAGSLSISAGFSNGLSLSGSNWVRELINPAGNANLDTNQLYRLQLTATSGGVPEPASWALMIAGFGMVGGALRRRALRPA
ncbi:MAG TPA: PEPxxWA-CTERM sorting domain-containing protein [Polymorphobacter sp.]|nr:PEPxxWA-CTERM sorting domain-containing protein [Polymorphobacter sp.]